MSSVVFPEVAQLETIDASRMPLPRRPLQGSFRQARFYPTLAIFLGVFNLPHPQSPRHTALSTVEHQLGPQPRVSRLCRTIDRQALAGKPHILSRYQMLMLLWLHALLGRSGSYFGPEGGAQRGRVTEVGRMSLGETERRSLPLLEICKH